jgi:exosome complex RNA-binding protein Csl4
MDKKKLVLPGEHLLSAEEAVPGENTYTEKDEIFSAAFGETAVSEGAVSIKRKRRSLKRPYRGMEVYCVVKKTSPNKAIVECIPVEGAEKPGSTMPITAVLPVTGLGRKGFVRDLRDEVKIGDIIRAEVSKVMKTGVDITIAGPEHGFLCVFCPRCRKRMDLKDRIFICSDCEWKERRKIPREKQG